MQELFDTTHKDVWKVLFKAAEVPPPIIEDHELSAKHPANPISSLCFTRCSFPQYIRERNLSLHTNLTGLGGDSEADRLPSSTNRRHIDGSPNGDVVSGARTVVEAVAATKKVAIEIDQYIKNKYNEQ